MSDNGPAGQRREAVARAIYMTHWKAPDPANGRSGAPVWENVSDNVRDWVLAQADSVLAALQSDLADGAAAERRTSALKLADALNDLVHPLLMKYISVMQKLSEQAGRPLHTALPGGPAIAEGPLPRHAPTAPSDTALPALQEKSDV